MHARSWTLAGSFVALVALWGCSNSDTQAPKAAALVTDLAHDDRLAYLLASRARTEPFLADTSDLIPALVSKLAAGQADPLSQAKNDLAAMGAKAIPELQRFFERNFPDALTTGRLSNALDVAGLMQDGAGHALLLRGLDHPSGSVRLTALRGLGRLALPEDYNRLREVAVITGSEGHLELGLALWHSDPVRVARELPSWVDGAVPAPVILAIAPKLSGVTDAQALSQFTELAKKVQGETRGRLFAALARAGDPTALADLRAWLVDSDPARRELAAHCLRDAGLQHELVQSLREDASTGVRVLAAQALAEIPLDDATRAALQSAISDPTEEVRGMALSALVKQHDPAGENETLELLKGEKRELERALLVLRGAWKDQPVLAGRALDVLDGLRTGTIGPLRVEGGSLWRAIAQVPLERAAKLLYDQIAKSPPVVEGISAHRWFVTQLGNTGEPGWKFLRERWRVETDPARRVDLVMASCYDRGDASRAFLEEVLDSGRITPLEILQAADLLAHLGPAERVAGHLKRVVLPVNDPLVRPALNNLLWSWYGLDR